MSEDKVGFYTVEEIQKCEAKAEIMRNAVRALDDVRLIDELAVMPGQRIALDSRAKVLRETAQRMREHNDRCQKGLSRQGPSHLRRRMAQEGAVMLKNPFEEPQYPTLHDDAELASYQRAVNAMAEAARFGHLTSVADALGETERWLHRQIARREKELGGAATRQRDIANLAVRLIPVRWANTTWLQISELGHKILLDEAEKMVDEGWRFVSPGSEK